MARLSGRFLAGTSTGLGNSRTRDWPAFNRPLFTESGEQDLWTFRRIRYGGHYVDEVSDVTLINWPQVDYWLTPLVGLPMDGESP